MANGSAAYKIFNSIVSALLPVEESVYLLNRPKAISEKQSHFIVVDIPLSIKPTTVGNDDYQYRSGGLLYCFYHSKSDGTPYIDAQTAWVEKVKRIFPVSDAVCELTKPQVIIRGLDEFGFHLTTISFRIKTKVNAV